MDWWEVSVRLPARLAETGAALLGSLTDGQVAIEMPFVQHNLEDAPLIQPEADAVVSIYVPDSGSPSHRKALRRRANRALSSLGVTVRTHRVGEHDWAEAWKVHFPVLHIERLVVRPVWRSYRGQPGEVVIDLDPGIAFGTGDHPTTRTCLQALQRLLRQGSRVLDLGSGSGILSIAAARLNAAEVWALDIDPFAVDATRANVERNGLQHRIVVLRGSLGDAAPSDLPESFDLVLANIASGPLIELAPNIAQVLAPGGTLIASGIIAQRLPGVFAAFEGQALVIEETIEEGEWRTVVAAR